MTLRRCAIVLLLAIATRAGGQSVTAFVDVNVVPMDRQAVLPRRVVLVEGLLNWMQLAVARNVFNRPDLVSVCLDREHRAGLDRPAVQVDGAGSAVAGVAADVGAGETELFADEMGQKQARLDVFLVKPAVNRDTDRLFHGVEQ